ncbi:DMT family transporter [Pseudomonas qingdaonensis]|uniref:DMT family transporter n=1 Tax=Pseudomonas qingdaonensis TaxID=2056231 RepID=UPI000C290972|nr:DMT family transporter [Pseudomonas qingdaonensis]
MNARSRGTLEMVTAMCISGTVGWFVVQSGQSPSSMVFWRCLFGAAVMALACWALGVFGTLRPTRAQWGWMLLGGVALACNWLLLFSAYSQASIAVATVVYHTQPFMLVGLGVLLFGERISASGAGWLGLAFVGMLLIVTAKTGAAGENYLMGVMLALASALLYAIAAIIAKRLQGVPPHLIVLVQLLVGAAMLWPWAQVPDMTAQPQAWAYLLTIGAVHTGLMSTLLYGAIQKLPTALIGALSFLYPAVAILVDWLAFDHPLSGLQAAGALAILLAAAGMNLGWRLGPKPALNT